MLTAKAIANRCGILTEGGVALEGSVVRSMAPKELDEVFSFLKVIARASPTDKYLVVARLNGYNLPKNEREWLDYHDPDGSKGLSWIEHRDLLLPRYFEEWAEGQGHKREVIGVTGDGTNDASALIAADIGIGMGLSGTKVAQLASDIITLDDKFSSIVQSILWGHCVHDNIRKFLQFQLTISMVTLSLYFAGSVSGIGSPLNPIMMLWANLIMDSLGALALATEYPNPELLKRKPYIRLASLICRPVLRNMFVQAMYQLTILLWITFSPKAMFGTYFCLIGDECTTCTVKTDPSDALWNVATGQKDPNGTVGCNTFEVICGTGENWNCYKDSFQDLDDYENDCLTCMEPSNTHATIIFNTFIFCQIFNMINCRSLFDDYHVLNGITRNPFFLVVIVAILVCQVFLIEFGGSAVLTSGLSYNEWFITVALRFGTIPVGFLMRFIPVVEDPSSSFDASNVISDKRVRSNRSNSERFLSYALA